MANTTNLSIEIPDVGADNNTWGTIANAAFESFDAIFKFDGTGTGVGLSVPTGKKLIATDGELRIPAAASPVLDTAGQIAVDTGTNEVNAYTNGQLVLVSTVQVQTLSNKTLSSPVSSGMPTISGLQTLTAVSSSGQTRTFALGSGIVGRITTTHSFTLAATGTASRRCDVNLFVQNTGASAIAISQGSNVVMSDASGGVQIRVEPGVVACCRFVWTGTQLLCVDPVDAGTASHYPAQSSSLTYPSS